MRRGFRFTGSEKPYAIDKQVVRVTMGKRRLQVKTPRMGIANERNQLDFAKSFILRNQSKRN